MKICKNCNIEYETGNFCKKCGSELVEKEEQQEFVCSECGMSLSSDFLFCPKCGTKVGDENKSVPAEFRQEEKKQIGVSSNDDEYIKSEIRKFIADFYHRDYDKVKTYVLLRDIGCDNVSKLSWELQRSFGITIPEEYDKKFRTVGDVCFAMDSLLKKN